MKTKVYWVALLASAALTAQAQTSDQEEYDRQNLSAGQYVDSTIAAHVQEQLARRRYYRGAIDSVVGPETRRAIRRYQSDHDLSATGRLNLDVLHALGLPPVASK
jgi:peptidoglycan hydrolase-like protein with peptidoglycan-binding domain